MIDKDNDFDDFGMEQLAERDVLLLDYIEIGKVNL